MNKAIRLMLGGLLAGCGPATPAVPVSAVQAQPSAAVPTKPAEPAEAPQRCELPPSFKVSLGAGKAAIDGKPIANLPKGETFSEPLWKALQPCESTTGVGRFALELASDAQTGQLQALLRDLHAANFSTVELTSGTGSPTFTVDAPVPSPGSKPGTGRWISVVQKEKGFEVAEVRREADEKKSLMVGRENAADESVLTSWVQAICTASTPCDGALIELRWETPASLIVQIVQKLGPAAAKGQLPRVAISSTPPQEPPQRNYDLWNVAGVLAPPVIQKVVRNSFDVFRRCYEAGLKRDPKLEGKVLVRFVIGRDGRVSDFKDGGSDIPDKAVSACVVSGFGGLTFPPPKGGIVTVVYPIMFAPGGK
jgi:uncharacterized Zn-binding protein involved in type VI secretion